MAGNKVRALVDQLSGKSDEKEQLHVQTVKITEVAHARLRALADLAGRSKTSLAADLLMAAIDDAIADLPNDPVPWPEIERRLLGTTFPSGELGLRDMVQVSAQEYLHSNEHEAKLLARFQGAPTTGDTGQVLQNGAHE